MEKILFIDRDGTIVEEPHDYQVDKLEKITWVKDVIPSLLELQKMGYKLVMVSNQDGLGTNSFPQVDFDICHNYILDTLASQGIHFSDVLICPHLPSDHCSCRKPALGLVTSYLKRRDINWEQSWVIGDRDTDAKLAENMGVTFHRIVKGESSFAKFCSTLKNNERTSKISRITKETNCQVSVNLDRKDQVKIQTGIGFFDHMLEQIAQHSNIGLEINVAGDAHIDDHHIVEDTAITLGECIKKALDDKRGIARYGFNLPMDEVLCEVALDLSGRSSFYFSGNLPITHCGDFHSEMLPHFFKSLSDGMGMNLHMKISTGNTHHMIESCFKTFARCLRQAIDRNQNFEIPSTKGTI